VFPIFSVGMEQVQLERRLSVPYTIGMEVLNKDGDILFQGPASDYDGKKVNAIWEALIECADTTCEDSSDAM